MAKSRTLPARAAGPLPDRVKWSFLPQATQAALPGRQRGRAEPAPAKRPADDGQPAAARRGIAITAYAIRAKHRSSTSAVSLHVVRRLRHRGRGLRGRLPRYGHLARLDWRSSCMRGRRLHLREDRVLTSLEGFRACPGSGRRSRLSKLYACPTVINNVESIASVPSIVANARTGSPPGHQKVQGI